MDLTERAKSAALAIIAKFPKCDQERLLGEHALASIEEGFVQGYQAGCRDQYAKDHTRTSHDENYPANA